MIQSGLTPEEQLVAEHIAEAWNAFVRGIPEHITTEEKAEFRQAIHRAQEILMLRVVRRLYPEYWR